jgi:PAS domain S-box-containing protein
MTTNSTINERTRSSLELLYSISRELTAQLDLRELLQRILQLTLQAIGSPAGSILVIDESGQASEGAIAFEGKVHDHSMEQLRDTYEHGLAGWVVENRQAVLIEDTSKDSRWLRKPEEEEIESGTAISVPLLAGERVVGVLTLVRRQAGLFSQDDLALVTAIADQAGIAVRNAQLFEETQSARQRYASLFEDNVDSILISDLNGQVTDANKRAESFLGYSAEQIGQLSIFSLHEPDASQVPDDLTELDPSQTLSYDSQVRDSRGRLHPVEVHVKRMAIGPSSFIQWIIRDISERLELAELRTDMTSMIFHDLRSPLGNIISSLEVLQGSFDDDDETIQSVLSIASRSSRRASRLVESLLDLDRLETEKAVLNKTEASIGGLIAEAVDEIHPTAEARGQFLRMSLAPQLPTVSMDVEMIRRVLINLLENAVKYTRAGDHIDVTARVADDQLKVSVRDNGPGILEQDRERIFDKFFRLSGESRPKGLGLGLAFCRLAVEAHGGRIWVDSEEGMGSTFTFTLPYT